MRKAFELKHVAPRSFMIGGLTAKWGVGDSRDDRYKNPLHAWTISGRADGSEDFSPLPDKMGTGNDLTLTGFDGTAGSGFENGYLAFDGVDDIARSQNFRVGQNWTLIGNWEFTTELMLSAGMTKMNNFRIYNWPEGIASQINQVSIFTTHPQVCGFSAVCSDGRLYDSDWQLYTTETQQNFSEIDSRLIIGANNNRILFTGMRFKNLAIYEGESLSKEQCRKAYDWLQTL